MKEIQKILITKKGHIFYIKDISQDYHSQFGLVKASDLSKEDGSVVVTNKGEEMTLLTPGFLDIYKKIKRGAQLITRKDVGEIIAQTGLNNEYVVVDCGSGSGGLACYLAYLCKKVISYDIRKDHIEVVEKNMKFLGLENYKLKEGDVYERIDEKDVDLVTVDVPEPWRVLENAVKALKPGGYLVSYSPSVTQSINVVNKAEEFGFCHLKTTEVLERNWDIRDKVAHPKFRDINHTGFLSFFRRIR